MRIESHQVNTRCLSIKKRHRSISTIAILLIVVVTGIGVYIGYVGLQFVDLFNLQSSANPSFCGKTENATSGQSQATLTSIYNEQTYFTLETNRTTLAYNVTAVSQNDSTGLGPEYVLSGVTDKNYWYQVGISWNWINSTGVGHYNGFRFTYGVHTYTGYTIYHLTGSAAELNFTGPIRSGDLVLLKLNFISPNNIEMYAKDWNTDTWQNAVFSNMNSSHFVPTFARVGYQFSTGIMMEWFHANAYQCSRKAIIFSSSTVMSPNTSFCVDEWNFTNVPHSEWFTNANDVGFPAKCATFSNISSRSMVHYSYAIINASFNDHEYTISRVAAL